VAVGKFLVKLASDPPLITTASDFKAAVQAEENQVYAWYMSIQ